MAQTLVIDTSFGSTVGIVGHDPVSEQDSRLHVERLQGNIDRAVRQAGLTAADIDTIVVGVGPAPFTGLRVGVVAAKALGLATGARVVGQDILTVQAELMRAARRGDVPWPDGGQMPQEESAAARYTLAVNDARRRQLYATMLDEQGDVVLAMDIDYPASLVRRIGELVAGQDGPVALDIVGHGAQAYEAVWQELDMPYCMEDVSLADWGKAGLRAMATCAIRAAAQGQDSVEPLYLRRPDVSVPHPLKHVLNHDGAERTA